jgi:CDP-paratose 2-epimerase
MQQIKKFNKINNQIFNIGGGKINSISLVDLTFKCEKLTKNKIKIKKIPKTSKFDIPYYVSDNKKIIRFYKWKPLKNIDNILKDIYTWLNKFDNVRNFF